MGDDIVLAEAEHPSVKPAAAPLLGAQAGAARTWAALLRQIAGLLTPGRLAAVIVVFGAAVRFYRLDGRSFWLDELVSAYPVRLDSPAQVMQFLHAWPDNMPLAYLLTWLLRGLGGS